MDGLVGVTAIDTNEGGATTITRSAVAVCTGVPESVTLTVSGKLPPTVGVPLSAPKPLRVSPVGRLPEEMVQFREVVPPVAVRFAEYAFPTWPLGSPAGVTCTGA